MYFTTLILNIFFTPNSTQTYSKLLFCFNPGQAKQQTQLVTVSSQETISVWYEHKSRKYLVIIWSGLKTVC